MISNNAMVLTLSLPCRQSGKILFFMLVAPPDGQYAKSGQHREAGMQTSQRHTQHTASNLWILDESGNANNLSLSKMVCMHVNILIRKPSITLKASASRKNSSVNLPIRREVIGVVRAGRGHKDHFPLLSASFLCRRAHDFTYFTRLH